MLLRSSSTRASGGAHAAVGESLGTLPHTGETLPLAAGTLTVGLVHSPVKATHPSAG